MATERSDQAEALNTQSYEIEENKTMQGTRTFFDLHIRSKHGSVSIFDDFRNIKDRSRSFPANQNSSAWIQETESHSVVKTPITLFSPHGVFFQMAYSVPHGVFCPLYQAPVCPDFVQN